MDGDACKANAQNIIYFCAALVPDMKLLFCCENYPPSVGGVQEVIRQIAERLAAKGHDVTVATSCHPLRPNEAQVNGVRVLSFNVAGGFVRGLIGEVEAYRNFVAAGDFDAVMIKAAQQWSFDALIPVLDLIKGRKVFIPCGFSSLHRSAFKNYFLQMPSWLAKFDSLIFYASEYRDIQFTRGIGLSKKIAIIPNGADEREFSTTDAPKFRKRIGVDEADLLLLTVGSVNGLKGHWEVARAFELATFDRPATLILNGNYPKRSFKGRAWQFAREFFRARLPLNALVRRINRQGGKEAKRVLLVDLPRAELVEAFKSSDLFLLASYVEYSPLVLFEAVAAGTPFISTPAGNAREIVRWTGGGIVCDAINGATGDLRPNPALLARKIEALASDPALMAELGSAGRRSFLEQGFSWAAIADRYELILSEGRI